MRKQLKHAMNLDTYSNITD